MSHFETVDDMTARSSPHPAEVDPQPRAGLLADAVGYSFGMVLDRIDRGIAEGLIETHLPNGTVRRLGGRKDGPSAILHVVRWHALLRMISGGSVGGYEGWERGEWHSPDLVALFAVFMRNRLTLGGTARGSGVSRLIKRCRRAVHGNDRKRARKNIMAHYDLGNEFYRCWLDQSMTYSSAQFAKPDDTLEIAQQRKFASLRARLALPTGAHLLEIGCGWGSFANAMAQQGHDVTAITISPAQLAYAHAQHSGPNYRLCDYRDVDGTYDGIASIEMIEAVGEQNWPSFVDTIARCLKPGGRAAIQFIAIDDAIFERYAGSVDFIQSYIFPGGMLISKSRLRSLAERRGLAWHDPVYFAADYARTLSTWHSRFNEAVTEGRLPSAFDERFIGLWRFYLAYCEGGFRGGGIDVGQVTLIKQS